MPLYRWEWRLRSSPEALWPLVADTNRFNRDVGLRGVETQPAADGRRRVRLGRLVEWEEEPFEWERPRRFSVRRRFLRGPIAELHEARSGTLIDEGQDPELVRPLGETVAGGDELELARLRPYRLADAWGAERRDVLELCLRATRAGLLDLHWDLLCPLCRGPQESAPRLAEVNPDVHCETCGIDFKADFERSVELTFRPSPFIREVTAAQYCVGGPRVTPHIVLQQQLRPREERSVRIPLEPATICRCSTTPSRPRTERS